MTLVGSILEHCRGATMAGSSLKGDRPYLKPASPCLGSYTAPSVPSGYLMVTRYHSSSCPWVLLRTIHVGVNWRAYPVDQRAVLPQSGQLPCLLLSIEHRHTSLLTIGSLHMSSREVYLPNTDPMPVRLDGGSGPPDMSNPVPLNID